MVIKLKPFLMKSSSAELRLNEPVAPAKPIVVDVVLGAITNVLVPEISAPTEIKSVVMLKAFAPIAIAPVTTLPAVMVVAPNT